ncbi:MAG TPA: alpha/beta fold hydrolase [Thermoanaerobaculia bacterium]|nr:alpha/beta fold hydrolase [Thermoanaerobaculia bacterium]
MRTQPARVLFLAVLSLSTMLRCGTTAALKEPAGVPAAARSCAPGVPIDEQLFVPAGGIEQWVTIRGKDCANPAVLFLHGGPGNTLTPFAEAIYGGWAEDFTLVQWDQRASGKTYGRNPPAEDSVLTVQQMTEDGIAVAEFVAARLGRKQVILLGGSWGSVLGVHMIQARPDLFQAYVGVSQLVNKVENQQASYSRVLALAREAGDTTTLAALEAIGAPPWRNPRHPGVMRRATRVYEAKTTTPAPPSWWVRSPEYATETMLADYGAGEDFSFLQFVGWKDDGMFSTVDLPKLGFQFAVPVYLVQGSEDLVTVKEVTERYFARIDAPRKKLIVVPRAGHDPNEALNEAVYGVLNECCGEQR